MQKVAYVYSTGSEDRREEKRKPQTELSSRVGVTVSEYWAMQNFIACIQKGFERSALHLALWVQANQNSGINNTCPNAGVSSTSMGKSQCTLSKR